MGNNKARHIRIGSVPYDITDSEARERLSALEGKVPSQASAQNQMADKEFVNSSISTATATHRGTYNSVSGLSLTTEATHAQIETALGSAVSGADNNDYVFVQIPTSNATPTQIAVVERYKFNGTAWGFEYALNSSGFTAAQWAALNSGITSGLVTKLSLLPTYAELAEALGNKVDVVSGKGLSTNDYDNTSKNKVDNIPSDPKYTDTTYSLASPSSNGQGGSNGLLSAEDKEKLNGIAQGATANTGTVTGIQIGEEQSISPTNGIVNIPAYPTTLPANDVSTWAKSQTKPQYVYGEIGYTATPVTVASGTNTLSLNGGTPLYIVTLNDNVTSLTLSALPAVGHSCHVIFTSSTAKTVTLADNHDQGAIRYVCPDAADPDPIEVPAGGYVEVDFLRAPDTTEDNNDISWIYVRGI